MALTCDWRPSRPGPLSCCAKRLELPLSFSCRRMCWALFDHDPARMSLYLLRDAAGPSHTDTLPGVQTHQNAPNNGVINGPFSTIAAVPDAASHGSSSGMMFLRWRMDVQGLRCGDSSSTTAATSSSSTMGEEVAVTNVFAGKPVAGCIH